MMRRASVHHALIGLGLSLAAWLSGCARDHWVVPATVPWNQARQDAEQCKRQAYAAGGEALGTLYAYLEIDRIPNQSLYAACMKAHGWQRVQDLPAEELSSEPAHAPPAAK